MSYLIRPIQLFRPALAHSDTIAAAWSVAFMALEAFVWAWFDLGSCEARLDYSRRRRLHIKAMARRRFRGRRLSWLRSECFADWAGAVQTWRKTEGLVRLTITATILSLFGSIFVPYICAAFAIALTGSGRLLRGGLAETLDAVDASELIRKIKAERTMGCPGYPPDALWRAYLASFILGLPSTNALIRRLQDEKEFRLLCGFGRDLPHRTTFNRFISRLDRHADLVQRCIASLIDQLAERLPHLGERVAVDSTTVRSHSNPNRKSRLTGEVSDLDASWTAKTTGAQANGKKEWYWGFKLHLAVDSTYDVPLFGYVTTAKRNDSPEMLPLLDKAMGLHDWMKPEYVMGDKGCDALSNYLGVHERGGEFIAPQRRRRGEDKAVTREQASREIRCTPPTCMGGAMEYVRSDPYKGLLFRCRPDGCSLKREFPSSRSACKHLAWDSPANRGWTLVKLSMEPARWNHLYRQRQSVERVFKSLKESRRLERHYIRGLRRIALHALMSVLSFNATYLVNLLAGEARPRWMVRKVA